jgi:hypothetical protein
VVGLYMMHLPGTLGEGWYFASSDCCVHLSLFLMHRFLCNMWRMCVLCCVSQGRQRWLNIHTDIRSQLEQILTTSSTNTQPAA